MVCLTLTLQTLDEWRDTLERYAGYYQCVELRVDLLEDPDSASVVELASGIPQPTIVAVRRVRDGGGFGTPSADHERERLALLEDLVASETFAFVDLEDDLRGLGAAESVEAAAETTGTRIIRSLHDFEGIPDDIDATLDRLAGPHREIPKLAVTPNSTADVHRLFRAYGPACDRHGDGGFILLGMGRFGVPTRILSRLCGALLTYTSPTGAEAAPGHIDPETMDTVYNASVLQAEARIFGVIGNPVLHSRSPHYHNPRFRRDELNAVYVPFPTDDVAEFFHLAETLRIQGFSVTIPHKEAALAHLTRLGAKIDDGSRAAGSCNTVVRRGPDSLAEGGSFAGANTDVPGFLRPLEELFGSDGLLGKSATIIGAGGAARAVCYALASRGVSLLVLNRTLARAEQLVGDIRSILVDRGREASELAAAPLARDGFRRSEHYRDIVVQTTGIGMTPNVDADPAAELEFSGAEVVYDIIYTPERTVFLSRAEEAGCRVISGRAMFDGQAAEQYRMFAERVRLGGT